MSRPVDRSRVEALARALHEKKLREERRKQSNLGGPGYSGGLMEFVRYFWHVLEPSTLLVDGWVMRAICMHLEAVTRGEIKRLLINVPPGCSKSLIVNCYWPAWEWSAANKPHLRYVTFAYAAHLTERDNARFRDVIMSPAFREMWGHRFTLTEDGKVKPSNDAKGWKFSSSLRGVGTGERGNRILCFPGDQVVATEVGDVPIRTLVAERMRVRAWSLNPGTKKIELKPIVGWHRNPGRQLVKVTTSDGSSVVCTHDHRIYTECGPAEASRLAVGSRLLVAPSGVSVPSASVAVPKVKVEVRPSPPGANIRDRAWAYAELCAKSGSGVIMARGDLNDGICCESIAPVAERPVPLAVGNIVGTSSVLNVGEGGVAPVSVSVPDLVAVRGGPQKRLGDEAVTEAINRFPANAESDTRVAVGNCPRHDFAGDRENAGALCMAAPVGIGEEARAALGGSGEAPHPTEIGHFIGSFRAHNRAPLLIAVRAVEFIHEPPLETFCVTVEGNNNLICGDGKANIICSNCDDIHNIKDGESEPIRSETVRWVKEGMSNRLNDMSEDVIIGIGQRVHEQDASAAMLEDGDYEHLCIPMRYDPSRHCRTSIGWEDPRSEYGELAWPERFPETVVKKLERTLGPYAFAAQYQQAPEPRGGGILKRDWWGAYELPLGAPFRHAFEFIVASLDPAYTAKEENDPSGFTVWGVYSDSGRVKIVLLHAWQKWLELHGQTMERLPNEKNAEYVRRTSDKWGLVEWVAHDCSRLRVNLLLVEDKASGHSVAQEIKRLYGDRDWGVRLLNPGALDKRARAYAIQHLFADGAIEAPAAPQGDLLVYRDWAQLVIDECAKFRGLPGDKDNLVDATTQALKFLRDNGFAVRDDERQADERDRATLREKRQPLYPA